jgi:hypothetical protein
LGSLCENECFGNLLTVRTHATRVISMPERRG